MPDRRRRRARTGPWRSSGRSTTRRPTVQVRSGARAARCRRRGRRPAATGATPRACRSRSSDGTLARARRRHRHPQPRAGAARRDGPHPHPPDPPPPGPHPGPHVLRAAVSPRRPRSSIWGPASPEASLQDRIARYISAPLSPVEVRELPCDVSFREAPHSEWEIGLGHASAPPRSPTAGPTLGYRITDGGTSLCYIPDHEPALGHRPRTSSRRSGSRASSLAKRLRRC